MRSILSQVSLPSPDAPGELWSKIMEPIQPLLAGFWWFVIHLVIPGAIAVGIVLICAGAITGNKKTMGHGRSAIFGPVMALVFAGIAILVANWAIGAYA
jgi:hypothetical protein